MANGRTKQDFIFSDGAVIIPLTKGKIAIIDETDFGKVKEYIWLAHRIGKVWYADSTPQKGRTVRMHRLIMDCPKGIEIDHIDGNGLNNRRSNLRYCNRSENCRNRRTSKNTSAIYKGVSFHRASNKYRAKIGINNKHIWLGVFENPIDAAKAYDNAAIELHGEFALTNKKLGLI